jgi:hypothetical protein
MTRVCVSFRGAAGDDPSPEGFGRQGEKSRAVLKILRARFLSRDCGIGVTA